MTLFAPWLAGCELHERAGGPIPARYDHIDLTASDAMRTAARRGQELRRKYRRGGTAKAAAMARRIVNGERIHPDFVLDMYAFYERFAGEMRNQRGTEKWDVNSDKVGPLRIAWDLWGGDAGWAWSRGKRRQIQAADNAEKSVSRVFSFAGLAPIWISPKTEARRAAIWRGWLDDVQRPLERQITAQWRTRRGGLFWDQGQRMARRTQAVLGGKSVRTVPVHRAVTADELNAIIQDEAETALLLEQFDAAVIDRGLQRAYAAAAKRLGRELKPAEMLDIREQVIADMVVDVQQYTKDRIANVIRAGVDQGSSIAEIQAAIIRDVAFSPMRALRVGRTETAKVASEGTLTAYDNALDDGAEFRVEWLSSRDSVVRDTHRPFTDTGEAGLDGQVIEVGGEFVSPSGATGRGPGLFDDASEVVNCRCTTIPTEIGG